MHVGSGKRWGYSLVGLFISCRIGLCYGTQMVLALETEPTDQKVDYVITEKEVYKSV